MKICLYDLFMFPKSLQTIHRNLSMPKSTKNIKSSNDVKVDAKDPISLDKSNFIVVHILAKPGAKQNGITGINSDGVGVQINAPPTDGEANTELVKYISSILGLRKSDVSLEKGFKSRTKTLRITGNITIEDVKRKFEEEIVS